MNLRDRFRLAHGLRWKSNKPDWNDVRGFIGGLVAAAALIAVLGMVERIEAATERAILAEKAASIYEASAKVLNDCERGAVGYHYADGRAYECGGEL